MGQAKRRKAEIERLKREPPLELMVIEPDKIPSEFVKLLEFIERHFHPTFDRLIVPGESRGLGTMQGLCHTCSIALTQFLHEVGYEDAYVQAVSLLVNGKNQQDQQLSIEVGESYFDGRKAADHGYALHSVVIIPSLNLLIDSTLSQARHPKTEKFDKPWRLPFWRKTLPTIVVSQIRSRKRRTEEKLGDEHIIAQAGSSDDGWDFNVVWFDDTSTPVPITSKSQNLANQVTSILVQEYKKVKPQCQ